MNLNLISKIPPHLEIVFQALSSIKALFSKYKMELSRIKIVIELISIINKPNITNVRIVVDLRDR